MCFPQNSSLVPHFVRSLAAQLYSSPLLPGYRRAVEASKCNLRERLFGHDPSYEPASRLFLEGVAAPLRTLEPQAPLRG